MPHCPVTVVDIGMGYAAFHLFFQSFEDLYLFYRFLAVPNAPSFGAGPQKNNARILS